MPQQRDAMKFDYKPITPIRIPFWLERVAIPQWDGINFVDPEPADDGDTGPDAGDPLPDVEKLKGALGKERENAKSLQRELRSIKAQLEAFAGIDPAKAKEALEIAQRQEELERQQAQQRAELENSIKSQYEPQLQELQAQLSEKAAAYENYKRDTLLQQEFSKADGLPGEFVAVAHALQERVKFDAEGNLVVVNAKGQPEYQIVEGKSQPKTVAQLIQELKKDPQYLWFARHFRGNERSGFGITSSQANLDGIPEGLSAWERVAAIREKQGRV